MRRMPLIAVTLTADAEYTFYTGMGQVMRGKLPAGLIIEVPADVVYETADKPLRAKLTITKKADVGVSK